MLGNNLSISHSSYEDGEYAYQHEDYEKALKVFVPLANKGDARAQYYLGYMYSYGHGVALDFQQAFQWYRKAAEQGLSNGQYYLGEMYEKGTGVEQDYIQAGNWYTKAALQGYAEAQKRLGDMYQKGWGGVPQDDDQAVNWYRKAAEQGHSDAKNQLGNMYLKLGNMSFISNDNNQAVNWYRKAAEQGNTDAQESLKNFVQAPDGSFLAFGVRSDGVLVKEMFFEAKDEESLIKEVFETAYDMAKDHPNATLACLHGKLNAKDNYGNEKIVDMGTIILKNEHLDEIRKYTSLEYFLKDASTVNFSSLFIELHGYFSFNRMNPYCKRARGSCGSGYEDPCPPVASAEQQIPNTPEVTTTTETPKTNEQADNSITTTTSKPSNPPQETPQPKEVDNESAPATETASTTKEETVNATSSADIIQYDTPATPFVIQMIDAAKDTEKLFAAKNSLT